MFFKEPVIFFLILFLFDEILTEEKNKTNICENDRHEPTVNAIHKNNPFLYSIYIISQTFDYVNCFLY